MEFLSFDSETGEIQIVNSGVGLIEVIQPLRPRVTYSFGPSRSATPTEDFFGGLIDWMHLSAQERELGEWRGPGDVFFQPWLEVLIRQAVRLVQLHGGEAARAVGQYIADHGPDWVGAGITALVLERFGSIVARLRRSVAEMAKRGWAPESEGDPRFDYAEFSNAEKLAELVARIAAAYETVPEEIWDMVIRESLLSTE